MTIAVARFREALRAVEPTEAEGAASLPGDSLTPAAGVVMDRAFTLPADPAVVWPWFVQLGKQRSGWYLPRSIERFIPAGRRATRRIDPVLQRLAVGDVIPDWGGREETFEVAVLEPPAALVHISQRGRVSLSWAITLSVAAPASTRAHLRLRLANVRRPMLADRVGGAFDLLTIAGLAAGLRERLSG